LSSGVVATIDLVLRGLIVAALAAGAAVAATHWAVRSKRLNAFGAWPRLVRRTSDPLLQPIERRIVRMGGNPQNAPFWLLGLVVAAGLVAIWLFRWIAGMVLAVGALAGSGPVTWAAALLRVAFSVVKFALIVRVIASWFGVSPYARWMRPVIWLTDWIIRPLRRVVPALGPIDITPLVAWLILIVAEGVVFSILFR
jgi:YggT family protein